MSAAATASLDLSFSRWGDDICSHMEEKYGVPSLSFGSIPAGFTAFREIASKIAERLSLGGKTVENFLRREEDAFEYFMRPAGERICSAFGTRAAIVGAENAVRGVADFLRDYLGAIADTLVVTDNPGGESACGAGESGVIYASDAGEIREILARSGAEIIFASSLEASVAAETGAALIEISHPIRGETILGKTYLGARGAVRLTEDYLSIFRRD